jgi:hypothetical protein
MVKRVKKFPKEEQPRRKESKHWRPLRNRKPMGSMEERSDRNNPNVDYDVGFNGKAGYRNVYNQEIE